MTDRRGLFNVSIAAAVHFDRVCGAALMLFEFTASRWENPAQVNIN